MKIHRAGYSIIRNITLILLITNLIIWLLTPTIISTIVSIASVVAIISALHFFRYPIRAVNRDDLKILCPADGTVCLIEECQETEYLNCNTLKVSVFMSPLNVHINWVPVKGKITYLKHKEGEFHAAFKDKSAEENERFSTAIQLNDGREILVKQVAGAVARRILNFLQPQQDVEQGVELGFIRFGSRVDLYLPLDIKLHVKLGDKVKGSQTIIGEL